MLEINYDIDYWKENNHILGLDEAGRGAWAGPIVVAGVVLPKNYQNDLIDDSKKLSPQQRDKVFDQITKDALEIVVEFVESHLVDQLNPKTASIQAMETIFRKIKNHKIDLIVTDFEKLKNVTTNQINLKKGDQCSISVAAASIIAKVTRDRHMQNLEKKYPKYTFGTHKGYGTKKHQQEITEHGILNEHRKSYKPIQKYLEIDKE